MSTAIGKKIRDLRTKENLSQQKLADLIGVRKGTIYTWEKGDHLPSMNTLRKLTDHPRFKQYEAWLLSDNDTPQEVPVIPPDALTETLSQLSKPDRTKVAEFADFLLFKKKHSAK